MRRWTVVVLTALLGSVLALPAAAQWKWRDRSGHTQYSDLPPPVGTADQDILIRPSPSPNARGAVPAATAPASTASGAPLLVPKSGDPELEAKRKKAEQKTEQEAADKKKTDDAKVAAARAENCGRAQAQLRSLDSGMRLATTDAKGERVIMDDTARAAEAKRTQAVIASDCK